MPSDTEPARARAPDPARDGGRAELEALSAHLGLLRRLLEEAERGGSGDGILAALPAAFVCELGFERAAVFRPGRRGGSLVALGSFSQNERFGGPPEPHPEALARLAREALAAPGALFWGGRGVGLRRSPPRGAGRSAAAVALAGPGDAAAALVCSDLVERGWTLASQRAFEIVGRTAGRLAAAAGADRALAEARAEIEAELAATRARLAARERELALEESRLRELEAELSAARRVRDTFLALLSHELRTPLAAVVGYAEILREERRPRSERAELLGRIEANARQLGRLLDDVLFLTEVEGTAIEPRREDVDLARLIEETAADVPRLGPPYGPRLSLSFDPAGARIETDPRLLGRALFHLIGAAAADAGPHGEVRVETRTLRDGRLRLRIRGPGGARRAPDAGVLDPFAPPSHASGSSRAALGPRLVRLCLAILDGRYRAWRSGRERRADVWLPARAAPGARRARAQRPAADRSGVSAVARGCGSRGSRASRPSASPSSAAGRATDTA